MRDVGDEVATDPIRPSQIADVVQHEHRAVAAGGGDRGRAGDERVLTERQLESRRALTEQGAIDLRRDLGMPHELDVAAAEGAAVETQQPLRGIVHQLHLADLVDDEHALHHSRQDGFEPRPIAREVVHAALEPLKRIVEAADEWCEVVARAHGEVLTEIALGASFDLLAEVVEAADRTPRHQAGNDERAGGRRQPAEERLAPHRRLQDRHDDRDGGGSRDGRNREVASDAHRVNRPARRRWRR